MNVLCMDEPMRTSIFTLVRMIPMRSAAHSSSPATITSGRRQRLQVIGLSLLALCVLPGCGKKAEPIKAPINPLAWANGQYMGDRYFPWPKDPPTQSDVVYQIADGTISGRVNQSIANPGRGLPVRIETRFKFSGPITLKADGNASFDIVGKLTVPLVVSYHVTGNVLTTGMSEFTIESTEEAVLAEVAAPETLSAKDMTPGDTLTADTNMAAPVKTTTKKSFTMHSQGFAVKR